MNQEQIVYYFTRSEQSIFCEIYFPKKVAHQGRIFKTLEDGYDEGKVKGYLELRVAKLLEEFKAYPALFDPDDYTKTTRVRKPVSEEQARKRIEMYKSPYEGWSMYVVDGVWFHPETKQVFEEPTQVVRLIFRFKSSFEDIARKMDCEDVLRNILFTTIAKQGRLYDYKIWGEEEKKFFLRDHPRWPKKKKVFVEKYYSPIAKEINKWIDDRALFVFAYVVRNFAENVLERKLLEEEIWVTNFFDQNLNVIKRVEFPAKGGENHVTS